MPTVPGDEMFVQPALPQGQPASGNVRATPDEFGWQVAQTLQKIGKMSTEGALLEQKNLNKVNVDDTYANRFDPAARSLYEEYLALEGKDAALGFPAYQQKLKDLAADFRANLPNDMQRQEFGLMAGHRVQVNLDAMARHQVAQSDRWIGQTGDAMARALSKRITDERYDFDGVTGPEGLIQSLRNVHASYGGATGQDEADSGLKAAAAIDKSLSDAVLTEAQTNPAGAKLLYDRYAQYMSSDAVRRHVLNNLVPALRQEQNTAVVNDVLNRFDLTGPDADSSNIHAAIDWIKDPENYKDRLSGPGQRDDLAKTVQGTWNRAREFHNGNQSAADSNFTDSVAKREISGIRLQTWRDPQTGLPPSGDILRAAMEHGANPVGLGASDSDTLVSLANDISNRRLNGRGQINQAYLQNLVTTRDFRDLTGLYDAYQDPAKSRWFDYPKTAFDARFAGTASGAAEGLSANPGPGGSPPDAMKLFPSFLMDLNGAIRDQGLKGSQIRDLANKMLDDVGNLLPAAAQAPSSSPG